MEQEEERKVEKVPEEQPVQNVVLPGEDDPALQFRQIAVLVAANVPATQKRQAVALPRLYEPEGQVWQDVPLKTYVPAAQGVQPVRAALLTLPVPHAVQEPA